MVLNQGWIYRDQISAKETGLTTIAFYSQRYRHSSEAEWRVRILAGQIRIDGAISRPETILRPGQRLAYHRPPWDEPEVPLNFDVLYADEDIVAIYKPSGLPVLPGGGFLIHTLLHQLQQRFPSAVPVHRLGRGTSGVLLTARSPLAKAHLSRQWRRSTDSLAGTLEKVYRGLVGPVPLPDRLTIDTPIGKLPDPILGYLYGATPRGKPAHTEVRVLERRKTATLLEIKISTGRPHQIRIHLATAGCPLLGDPLYSTGAMPRSHKGSSSVPSDLGYHLHAHRLKFIHPRTGKRVDIVASPPGLLKIGHRETVSLDKQPPDTSLT